MGIFYIICYLWKGLVIGYMERDSIGFTLNHHIFFFLPIYNQFISFSIRIEKCNLLFCLFCQCLGHFKHVCYVHFCWHHFEGMILSFLNQENEKSFCFFTFQLQSSYFNVEIHVLCCLFKLLQPACRNAVLRDHLVKNCMDGLTQLA